MATISSSWTENQTLRASASLAASGTDTNDIDLAANGYIAVHIQWIGTFNASATDGCTIEVFGSPDSGTTEDTIALYSFKVDVDAGATEKVSFVIQDVPYIAVKITNNDGSYAISSCEMQYAGLEFTSA